MLAETQSLPVAGSPLMQHVSELIALAALFAVKGLWDWRKDKATIQSTRGDLDHRFKSLTTAIDINQQSNVGEFGKVHSRLDKMEGSVEIVKKEVTGLREREIARLEADAGAHRRRKR